MKLRFKATGEQHDEAEVYDLLEGRSRLGRLRRENYPGTLGRLWAYYGHPPAGLRSIPATWPTLPDVKAWLAEAEILRACAFESIALPVTVAMTDGSGLFHHHSHDRQEVARYARLVTQQTGTRTRLIHVTDKGARVVAGFKAVNERKQGDLRAIVNVRPLAPCLECGGRPAGCADCDGGAVEVISGGAGSVAGPEIKKPAVLAKWEKFVTAGDYILPTPGGWLFSGTFEASGGGGSLALCHIPDPSHSWPEARAACGMPAASAVHAEKAENQVDPLVDALTELAKVLNQRAVHRLRGRLADLANDLAD